MGKIIPHSPYIVVPLVEAGRLKDVSESRRSKWEANILPGDRHVEICRDMRENPTIGLTIQGTEHECAVEVEEDTSGGLAEEPLVGEGVRNLYVDGARKYIGEPHTAWAAVDSEGELIAEHIPGNHSAQMAELIALTKALEWGKGKRINAYTHSRYAFGVLHDYMTAWSRRGFVTSSGGHIQHENLIKDLILAARKPIEAAVIKVLAHRIIENYAQQGSSWADQVAKDILEQEWVGMQIPGIAVVKATGNADIDFRQLQEQVEEKEG
ncbi:hypothetical protein scyTo_0015214 [Scyliorhinus torazame]|uniref:RNase H type-1 domain-containing protein n=1 Tax=Scyliorhinus torazame TaxID=75743 RepID=A0A401P5N5_SCYTO|nr:hypothetical protein [Scyliorhinus torazame]